MTAITKTETLNRHQLAKPHIRPGQPKMGPQGFAFIGFAEQTALAQQRHDFRDEEVALVRQHRWHQVEAIGSAGLEPILHDVSDLFRRSRDSEMSPCTRELGEKLAQCWPLFSDKFNDGLHSAAGRLVLAVIWKIIHRQGLVE